MKYVQVHDGEWLPLVRREFIKCCDCGLVHEVIVRTHRGKLQVQYVRDNRKTAQGRRWQEKKKKLT